MSKYKDFVTETGYGVDPLGLCGINCYHSFSAFIEGVSVRSYTDDELDELNNAENVKKEYKGKEYTTYEATQQMRKLERIMRARVKSIRLLEEGGADKETITAARARNKATQHEYAAFARAMNLKEQRERVGIVADNTTETPTVQIQRNKGNSGIYKPLELKISKASIRDVAKETGIDIKGLTLTIEKSEEALNAPFFGMADTTNVGNIIFMPRAFSSREELTRTLFHEKIHVDQFREYGVQYVKDNAGIFEALAYAAEDELIEKLKKEGIL